MSNRKILLFVSVLLLIVANIYFANLYKKAKEAERIASAIEETENSIEEIIEEKPKEYTYEEALAAINKKDLKANLEYLASDELEGRMSGKKGNVLAADFVKKKYESFGLDTMYQKFSIRRLNPGPKRELGNDFTQNIIAWIPGSDPLLKDEIVVIGAHMDHIGYGPSMSRSRRIAIHPGADDNASGTVALIEVAKAFSMLKGKVKRTVVFQSYSAEEMGLIGSRYYCNNPLFPVDNPNIRKHIAMVNMDMVGYLGRGQHFTGFNSGNSSPNIRLIVNDLNKKYSFANSITSRGSGGSDHAPFYNKRIPVAFLHTGLHAYYHTPEDTPDKINYDGLTEVAKYAFELTYNIAQKESAPAFNIDEFEEMPYVHDHGYKELSFPSVEKK